MFGFLKAGLSVAAMIYSKVAGGKKFSVTDLLPLVIGQLLPAIQEGTSYGELSTKEKFDAWLEKVDDVTGTDAGAVDILPSLPADKEEELFDALKKVAQVYGYNRLKVPGYFV